MKRFFDIAASGAALILLLPLFLAIGVAIKLDSKGRIFFRQERVGLNGNLFKIFKFRSMVADAPKRGPYFTAAGDPRITKAGSFLRKTSLDELPQLLNVLLGDMSLVGPRPDVPAQRGQYTEDEWTRRHTVRPGITGLAQATLRSSATPEERKALDLEYVGKADILSDIKILFMTVKQVLCKGGF